MQAIASIEQAQRKSVVTQVQSGDTVRVHQLIREGSKQRVQVFEGVVIRTHRMNSATAVLTVRRIASNVGVEKTFLIHSPNVQKIEVMRRAKVRRNFLSYLRGRRGESARLQRVGFDRDTVKVKDAPNEDPKAEVAELVADQAADDAELTEIGEGVSEQSVESTDEVVKEENKEAAVEESAESTDDAGEQGDEDAARGEEVQEGLDKAAKEDE